MENKPFRIEQTPNQLLVFSGNEPFSAHSFKRFLDAWATRLSATERFGVTLVFEAHAHTCIEADAVRENAAHVGEETVSHLLNDFRRNHRATANTLTTGFARVFEPDMAAALDKAKKVEYAEHTRRFAKYSFGVRGRDFSSLAEALDWLESIIHEAPVAMASEPEGSSPTGLYYGSTTGTTERVAERVQHFAGLAGRSLSLLNIADLKNPHDLLSHEQLILGIPTWNNGELQDDWLPLYSNLDNLDFTGKQVALFGVGDQLGYPDHFLDAVGILGKKLQERGASLVGYWSAEGYTFEASKALVGDEFMGLGIDDYNQAAQTDNRIARWLGQVYRAFDEHTYRNSARILESSY